MNFNIVMTDGPHLTSEARRKNYVQQAENPARQLDYLVSRTTHEFRIGISRNVAEILELKLKTA